MLVDGDIDFLGLSACGLDRFAQTYINRLKAIPVSDQRYACVEKALYYLSQSNDTIGLIDKIIHVRYSIGIVMDMCGEDERQKELDECCIIYEASK